VEQEPACSNPPLAFPHIHTCIVCSSAVVQAVKKAVKGADYIDDDEHNKNQLLLGLGCLLVALGAPIIGFFGKKVNTGEC